ncbi:MAG TPA: ubiquinol-cytochrome c reductase iron-sulfur subunit [Candidatus Dormibacteraeota bacterium]|nr:ubiquinol-cytochrome c reductase iron-sulfur subunit [Candidatus Dormibacteraeota bacterium]
MADKEMSIAQKRISRRKFMILGINAAGAGTGLLIAAPIVGSILSPVFYKSKYPWVMVADIQHVPVGVPTAYVVMVDQGGDSWQVPKVPRTVYVVKLNLINQVQLIALSNVCTHMQCDVHWDINLNIFFCPCHGGEYSMNGTNIGGPPPQPLFRYQHKLVGNTLFIRDVLVGGS